MAKTNKLKTLFQFTKNIKTTGAIYQTSPKVEKEISSKLSTEGNKIFIEFGLGHGNITKEILKRIDSTSKLYSFEINEEFCELVRSEIKDDRLQIINTGAENIDQHIKGQVDGIVSSIPLTFFDDEKLRLLLEQAKNKLKEGKIFSQILYSKKMRERFIEIFGNCDSVKVPNFPIAYVHHCTKEKR